GRDGGPGGALWHTGARQRNLRLHDPGLPIATDRGYPISGQKPRRRPLGGQGGPHGGVQAGNDVWRLMSGHQLRLRASPWPNGTWYSEDHLIIPRMENASSRAGDL